MCYDCEILQNTKLENYLLRKHCNQIVNICLHIFVEKKTRIIRQMRQNKLYSRDRFERQKFYLVVFENLSNLRMFVFRKYEKHVKNMLVNNRCEI